jgi:hypothetical protein
MTPDARAAQICRGRSRESALARPSAADCSSSPPVHPPDHGFEIRPPHVSLEISPGTIAWWKIIEWRRNGCCSPSSVSRRRAVGCMRECGCVAASNEGIGGSVSFASELASQTEQRPHRAGPGKQRPASAQPGASPDIILETVRMVLRGREMRELPAYGINIAFDDGVLATCRVCRTSWGVGRRQFTAAAWWSCPRGCGRIPPRPSDTARIS